MAGIRTAARVLLGASLVFAGVSHLTFARDEFRAQVPELVTELAPVSEDAVVLGSGVAEVALGGALLLAPHGRRRAVGRVAAAFFAAVFPGNISQWLHRRDAFGLDTDDKRFTRLLFQPVLIAWALWSTRPPRR
ncbi:MULTISPECIES: membrane protein [Agrococcus]|uniref:DoxX family protein n=1 Tax=Agrococcus pavilionensis RW1 TaxID=1330458 RepID=U1LSF0_9MICO|nr:MULTISPECIES: membrane protein [Agrococcus]ERG65032.1 hypothetical protein L332_11335 [Agrococcus pavilionensis RW1]MBO1770809.1 hypothetical protein [Agrococcus sp. TF02-05]